MTPERLAEIRAIASGEDWSPAQREDLTELLAEIDKLATKVTIFQQQRDGALGTMRAFGDSLGKLSTNELMQPSGQEGWAFVAYAARRLRIAAGPVRPAHDAEVRLSPTTTPGTEPPTSE